MPAGGLTPASRARIDKAAILCGALAVLFAAMAISGARAAEPERAATPAAEIPSDAPGNTAAATGAVWGAFEILGTSVAPGTRRDLHWTAGQSFAGRAIETPVAVIHGVRPGPILCMTAAIHGDELNGVEIVRRVLANIDGNELTGTVIGAPIVNLLGFSRGSRYLPDRRDLNRYFPGDPNGSSASRIAHALFSEIIHRCERLVDFHTGSFKRTNLPQLRANLAVPEVRGFVKRFGGTAVLHKPGGRGTLRNAATTFGVPTVTFELGEPGTLQLNHVRFGVRAMETLLDKLGMVARFRLWTEPQPVFYRSHWLRAYRGGILTSTVRVGARVAVGDVLGVVTNPLTNEQSNILSPYGGRLLGRALNQFVIPGFATFHIGIEAGDAADIAAALKTAEDDDYERAAATAYGASEGGSDARAVPDDFEDDIVDEEIH